MAPSGPPIESELPLHRWSSRQWCVTWALWCHF